MSDRNNQEGENALARGLPDLAEAAFRRALEKSGGDDGIAGQALRGLAVAYELKAQYQPMLENALKGLERYEGYWGPQSQQVAECAFLAAVASCFLDDHEQAKRLFQQSREIRVLHFPESHECIVAIHTGMFLIALKEGADESELVRMHELLLPVYQRLMNGGSWVSFTKLNKAVDQLVASKKNTDAEVVLKREQSILKDHFPTRQKEITEVANLYKTFATSGSGGGMRGWQLDTTQPDEDKARERKKAQAAVNQDILSQLMSSVVGGNRAMVFRRELVLFLDTLAGLIEVGVSVNPAVVQTCDLVRASCPRLCTELESAITAWTQTRKPIYESLTEMAGRFDVDEFAHLATTLAMANKTGGSVAAILRQQSFAIRHSLEAQKLEQINFLGNFAGLRPQSSAPLTNMEREEEQRRKRRQ